MRRKRTILLAYGGLCAALIALLTAFVRLPAPMLKGYAHLGDLGILFCSMLLGPFCAVPAAAGSALADVLATYPLYAPFTLAIKALMGFWMGQRIVRQRFSLRNLLTLILNAVWMVGAYFLTDALLFGMEAAIGSFFGNLVQGIALVVGGMVLIPLVSSLPPEAFRRIPR